MITSSFQVVRPNFPGIKPGSATLAGPAGLSAYQVAVSQGYVGTVQAWLAGLVGPPGTAPTAQQMQAAVQPLVGAASGLAPLDANSAVPLANLQVRTAQVTRAARPTLVAAGGSFSGFLASLDPDASDGSWEAVYVEAFAPVGGILANLLSTYLVTQLSQSAGQAATTLQSIWSRAATVAP